MAEKQVIAPMSGAVKDVLVAPGDRVEPGQEVVILDSMKMEIPVEAEAAGTVARVLAAVGEAVEEGAPLLALEG